MAVPRRIYDNLNRRIFCATCYRADLAAPGSTWWTAVGMGFACARHDEGPPLCGCGPPIDGRYGHDEAWHDESLNG